MKSFCLDRVQVHEAHIQDLAAEVVLEVVQVSNRHLPMRFVAQCHFFQDAIQDREVAHEATAQVREVQSLAADQGEFLLFNEVPITTFNCLEAEVVLELRNVREAIVVDQLVHVILEADILHQGKAQKFTFKAGL